MAAPLETVPEAPPPLELAPAAREPAVAIPLAEVIGTAALARRASREREALALRRAFEDVLGLLCMALAVWSMAAELGAAVFAGVVGIVFRFEVAERAALGTLPLLPAWMWLGQTLVCAGVAIFTAIFAAPSLRDARAAPLMTVSLLYQCLVTVPLVCADALGPEPAALSCARLVDMARLLVLLGAVGRIVLVGGIAVAGAGAAHAHSPALIVAHVPPIAVMVTFFFATVVVWSKQVGGAAMAIVARLDAALVPEWVYGAASPRRALSPTASLVWGAPRQLVGEVAANVATLSLDATYVSAAACACVAAAGVTAVAIGVADEAHRRAAARAPRVHAE